MKTKETRLIEIKLLGRGGQGTVSASNILAIAAYLDGYRGVQAFPFFGSERRGAPVSAFTRLGNREIRVRSQIYKPNIVIVLDPTLFMQIDVTAGVSKGGCIILNTSQKPNDVNLKGDFKVATVDANSIVEELNLKVAGLPVYNTPMLGAFSKATNLISFRSIKEAIVTYFGEKRADLNVRASEIAYEQTKIGSSRVCSHPANLSEMKDGGLEIKSLSELPLPPISKPRTASMGAPTGIWRENRPVLHKDKCKQCLLCWLYCPDGVIAIDKDKYPVFDYEYCKGCGICAYECHFKAIELVKEV
jgi:2-oxoacid:acceptor oxidoreductase gamma subunit (pyruvate/2-ketoisovalerate family)/2-oxoacid:acceptor oxidoreductase delta subunit (pyruvate/2-ketoisovalerate family)